MTDQPDPREVYRQCNITEHEFEIILDHHRSTIMAQQYESVALRTHSTCFLMRAIHAVDRLMTLDPAAWKRVDEELEQARDSWIGQAAAEIAWEEQDDVIDEVSPATDEEWASLLAHLEQQVSQSEEGLSND